MVRFNQFCDIALKALRRTFGYFEALVSHPHPASFESAQKWQLSFKDGFHQKGSEAVKSVAWLATKLGNAAEVEIHRRQ